MSKGGVLRCAALAAACLGASACARPSVSAVGDPHTGAVLIGQAQCGACHAIPGIAAADGLSGPPLRGFARRTTIAGVLANTPSNLVAWLREPQKIVPGNAMPDTHLSDAQAGDVAAYLDSLR